MNTLQIASLIGLLLYFAVLLFAVSKDKANQNVLDYFFAGRSLPFWALSITFIASWWGAGSALSTADLAYTDGLSAFWYYGAPVLIATFLMIGGAKAIRRVGYLTQGKMMAARYSEGVSKVLSVMILIFMTFSAASQMVGVGDFFGTYLGLDYELAVLAGTGVVLTDIIQFVLLVLSAVLVFVTALTRAGGLGPIAAAAAAAGKEGYMDITSGTSRYAMYIITFGCAWMIQANVWQRISAARSDRDARKMTVLSFFAYIPLYLIVVLTGMAGLVLFPTLPQGGVVTAVVVNYLSPVLGAVAFVGISAAVMSTMDSLINTGAMTLALDLNTKEQDENKKLRFSRAATLLVTVCALLIALGVRSILQISWMASDVITTGVFVPLVAGFVWRRGNAPGAMASMVAGLSYCLYNLLISVGVPLPSFWAAQSAQQVILGVSLSAAVYVAVSLCTKPDYEKADAFIAAANLLGRR